jgi:hypothetical protein
MRNFKAIISFFAGLFVLLTFSTISFGQSYSAEIFISNQPQNYIVFGSVKGDNFTPIDSSYLYPESEKVNFKFPENAHPGVYRIVMGKTAYARIMDEPAQQLNFIFNKESIVFKTDFKEPLQKLEVIESEENKIWFDFLSKDKMLWQQINELKKELDYYWSAGDTSKAIVATGDYNSLQMEREQFVNEIAQENEGLLVSSIIYNQRKPILDGYLTPDERIESFKKGFFRKLDFSDERLIQSAVYTDNVFEYLVSYNHPEYSREQREKEYIKAVDIVLTSVNKNKQVYLFIRDYLIHGFEVLQLKKVIDYINKKYPG